MKRKCPFEDIDEVDRRVQKMLPTAKDFKKAKRALAEARTRVSSMAGGHVCPHCNGTGRIE